jgi:hypothetical protein
MKSSFHRQILFLPLFSITFDCLLSQFSAATANSELDSILILERERERERVTLHLVVFRQSINLGPNPLRPTTIIFFNWTLAVIVLMYNLTRVWVCRLQLLLALTSAVILRSESHRTHHILLCQIRDPPPPQPGGPGPRIYIPQGQGGPIILPGTGFRFRRLLRLASCIVACWFLAAGMCFPSSCLAMDVSSDFTIPDFGHYVTVSYIM